MRTARYHIPDEPRPSALDHLAVNPLWPLFAQMLVGSWLALPWFLLNSHALGSFSRRREALCVLASVLGSGLLLAAIILAEMQGWLAGTGIRLSLLSIMVLKLGMAYALFLLQATSFEIRQHFGGGNRNGIYVVAGAMLLETLAPAMFDWHWLPRTVLG